MSKPASSPPAHESADTGVPAAMTFPASPARTVVVRGTDVSGNTAYHLPEAFRLRGELKVASLERAIRELVRRHEDCGR